MADILRESLITILGESFLSDGYESHERCPLLYTFMFDMNPGRLSMYIPTPEYQHTSVPTISHFELYILQAALLHMYEKKKVDEELIQKSYDLFGVRLFSKSLYLFDYMRDDIKKINAIRFEVWGLIKDPISRKKFVTRPYVTPNMVHYDIKDVLSKTDDTQLIMDVSNGLLGEKMKSLIIPISSVEMPTDSISPTIEDIWTSFEIVRLKTDKYWISIFSVDKMYGYLLSEELERRRPLTEKFMLNITNHILRSIRSGVDINTPMIITPRWNGSGDDILCLAYIISY